MTNGVRVKNGRALNNRGIRLGATPHPTHEQNARSVVFAVAARALTNAPPSLRPESAPEIDYDAEFAVAAEEIGRDFQRRLTGLHKFRRAEIIAAIQAAVAWRSAALETLRRTIATKRDGARASRRMEGQLRRPQHQPAN